MKKVLKFCCRAMGMHIDETSIISYNEVFDEYGISLLEDKVSYILLEYCPWCGKKLPDSKREQWVDTLEEMGFEEPLFRKDIPEEYKTSCWRKD